MTNSSVTIGQKCTRWVFSSISSEQGKGKARGGACWEGARFTCQRWLLSERGPAQGGLCTLTMALKEGGLKWKVVLSVFLWRALYIPNMMFLGNKRCNRKYYIFYLNISSQRGREFLEVLLGIPPVWRGATMKSEKRVQLPSPTLIVHMTKIKILMQAHCILTDKTKSCKSVNINLVFMYST